MKQLDGYQILASAILGHPIVLKNDEEVIVQLYYRLKEAEERIRALRLTLRELGKSKGIPSTAATILGLQLPKRITNGLHRAGFNYIEDLFYSDGYLKEKELLRIRAFGIRSLTILSDALYKRGYLRTFG